MKYNLTLTLLSEEGTEVASNVLIQFEKECEKVEQIGLSLQESKSILTSIQTHLVQSQINQLVLLKAKCKECNQIRKIKDYRTVTYQTLFGDIDFKSPRYFYCQCESSTKESFSPLSEFFKDYVSPELYYMESKWSSLMSYGMTANLLKDCLPINEKLSIERVRKHTYKVGTKLEKEIGEERYIYAIPSKSNFKKEAFNHEKVIVGIDGGYLRSWEDKKKNFETIVGKSIPDDGIEKSFGFVQTYDKKSKQRLYEILKSQGITHEDGVCFMSDGEGNLRKLQKYLNPNSKHILDWFHITMKITVLNQFIKGLINIDEEKGNEIRSLVDSIKWKLWHGKSIDALAKIEKLSRSIIIFERTYEKYIKLVKHVSDFFNYISRNIDIVIDYSKRWREGKRISTAVIESLVNSLLNKRFSKKEMQWKKQNAHLLLQVRTKVIDNELEEAFKKWYPDFKVQENNYETFQLKMAA